MRRVQVNLDLEILCDGPYLRVVLPDVLPPDWEALRRDLEPEIEEGVRHLTLVVGEPCRDEGDDAFDSFRRWLGGAGVAVDVVHR
jgi:hypothetical protein